MNRTESFTLKVSPATAEQIVDRAYMAGVSRNELLNRIIEAWLAAQRQRDGIPDPE